ncbi:MAG: hypothetical protein LQ351_000817 [Letrouitia transgressa]|nr:MAG: hypothetical protein LQ351_000817 [Letrouitia transgressa]
MNDPSDGVPPQLLKHVHLVSTYRYPVLTHVQLDSVVENLKNAVQITKEVAAMNWTFVDAPKDGTMMLVWQPLDKMGTHSASDGYIWADAEQAFSSEAGGYVRALFLSCDCVLLNRCF